MVQEFIFLDLFSLMPWAKINKSMEGQHKTSPLMPIHRFDLWYLNIHIHGQHSFSHVLKPVEKSVSANWHILEFQGTVSLSSQIMQNHFLTTQYGSHFLLCDCILTTVQQDIKCIQTLLLRQTNFSQPDPPENLFFPTNSREVTLHTVSHYVMVWSQQW